MKYLLIGGCGLIGSHVVDELLSRGADIKVISKRPELFRELNSRVKYIFDSMCNYCALEEVVSSVDIVIHLASTTTPGNSNRDICSDLTDNLLPTVKLLEICRSTSIG